MDLLNARYRIVAPLGEGGAGTTWRAVDTQTGAEVTVKKLNIPLNATNEAMLERETRLLGQLDHPQIPRFVQAFVDEFRMRRYLHLVLDFVPGEPLSAVMAQRRFSQDQVRDLVIDLLGIVAWLHALAPPVIHRDIKPSNLILRPDGKLALIDFGLATDAIDRTFLHTMAVGTLGYQAPEQIAGDPCPASDIYSVGVVALELLTRASPRELLSGQTLRWQGRAARLSPAWRGWLERALAGKREARFADGAEALRALTGEPEPAASAPEPAASAPVTAGGGKRRRGAADRTSRGARSRGGGSSAGRAASAAPKGPTGRAAPPGRQSYVPGGEQAFKHFFGRSRSGARPTGPAYPRTPINPAGALGLLGLLSAFIAAPYFLWTAPSPPEPVKATPSTRDPGARDDAERALAATSACRGTDPAACRDAARALLQPRADGRVPQANEQLARSLLATGCQGGDGRACIVLGDLHGYNREGGRWFARGCALEQSSACYALTLLPPGVTLSLTDAIPLEERCAPSPGATAPSEACETLATLHRMGRIDGGGPNVARRLIERACADGGCVDPGQPGRGAAAP